MKKAPILVNHACRKAGAGEHSAGSCQPVTPYLCRQFVVESGNALLPECFPVICFACIFAGGTIAVIIFGKYLAHIQPVLLPESAGQLYIGQAHVISLDAVQTWNGGELANLVQQVLLHLGMIGAEKLVVFHKGALLRLVA